MPWSRPCCFYVVSAPERLHLIKAIEVVEALMKAFQKIIQSPLQQARSCTAGGCWPTEVTCDWEACQKRAWARKAEEAGLLRLLQAQVQADEVRLASDDDIQGRLSELRERKQQFEKLCGWFTDKTTCTQIATGNRLNVPGRKPLHRYFSYWVWRCME